MKKNSVILLIIVCFFILGCQPILIDPAAVQNTATAAVAQAATQSVKLTAFSANLSENLTKAAKTPVPTKVISRSTNSDFQMSWNIYSSVYNSLGGILTISKQGSRYIQTLVMHDGSSQTVFLTVKAVNGEERLYDERFDDYYGDYMVIESDGTLTFYDNKGYIYSVAPLK